MTDQFAPTIRVAFDEQPIGRVVVGAIDPATDSKVFADGEIAVALQAARDHFPEIGPEIGTGSTLFAECRCGGYFATSAKRKEKGAS